MFNYVLINFIGFLLSLAIVVQIIVIITVYRQRIPSFFIPLYLYLNVFLIIIEFCTIFLLQNRINFIINTVVKVRFIAQVFIPPLLIHINQNYSLGTHLPNLSFKNIIFFFISSVFGILTIFGLLYDGWYFQNGMVCPQYTFLYWLFILYFYLIFAYLVIDFSYKYRRAQREPEIRNLKNILVKIFPIAILLFSILHVSTFIGFIHPIIFLAYPFAGYMVIYLAFKFQILEYNENTSGNVAFFLTTFVFIFVLSSLKYLNPIMVYVLSIPLLLTFYITFQYFQMLVKKSLKKQSLKEDYVFEDELEIFTNEIGQYIDDENLSRFIGEFASKVLSCTKCAVVLSKFDIKPYQISYIEGFTKKDIDEMLSSSKFLILNALEEDHKCLDRFSFSPRSQNYKLMEEYGVDLVIPLVSQDNMLGFVILGGERKITRFLNKDIRFAKFLSINGGNALQNIQAIQRAIQSQKMADLGLLASQMAHDFQSFISLVKIETENNSKLRKHATYMEKLVKDLLNYARPRELHLSPLNINQLIDMTLDLVNVNPNITVEKNYSNDFPAINIDSVQMRRVFLNLFENSINAMKENGGRLKITTRPLRPLSTIKRTKWIYIEILDEGIGIQDDFLENIFDPFFTTRKIEGGNGMGLAIVKQIISRHRGFIDVTSKLDKGTIFNIRLPYIE
jgi:signal transduction histidine kinase